MHITLHYTPHTRAIRPCWLLEELGVLYDHAGMADSAALRNSARIATRCRYQTLGDGTLPSSGQCS